MVNPAFLKIGLGGLAVTSAGATGIVFKNEIKDFFEKQFNTKTTSTYVIVKKTDSSVDSDISKELYETDNVTKNYKCVLKGNTDIEDETCEISLINSPANNKLNNLDDIKTSSTKATKEKITNDTFFKLTISDSVLDSAKWDGSQTVDIVSKTEKKDDNANKKYGSFTLNYKISETDEKISITGKTNWIIGKITGEAITTDISGTTNLTCSINGETPASNANCSIFKINGTLNNVKDLVTTNIVDPTNSKDDYALNKHFVIDLKKTSLKKNISDFIGKTITVAINSGNTKVGDFSFVTALTDDSKDFTKTSKTIILS